MEERIYKIIELIMLIIMAGIMIALLTVTCMQADKPSTKYYQDGIPCETVTVIPD